ncbi:MAG TPA: glycosyltransferase family 2 protein [Longimicrobiales bacterium]|nr:glycosyltransferase family 2 protein [Longimicrobiales bacterium]
MDAHFLAVGLEWFEWAVLAYFLMVNSFYLLLLASAAREMRRHVLASRGESRRQVLSSAVAPRISVLAPAHNEAATIETSLRALLALEYPDLEIVVINDGSSDATLDVLRDRFELEPVHTIYRRRIPTRPVRQLFRSRIYANLVVADKENGGKADALNAGVDMASGGLVCAIDADTLIEPDALLRMVRPFLLDDRTLAAGGTIRVVNGCTVRNGRVTEVHLPRRFVAALQVVEYMRAFLFGRLGWNRLGGNLIISGAFGIFRRDEVIAAGGYLHDTVGEDVELVARLRKTARDLGGPDRVAFIPDPVAWTEVPESLRVLRQQRDRWHRGLADTLWRHRAVTLNPRYGVLGLFVFPYFVFVELIAPVIELVGLAGLCAGLWIGALDARFALLFFLVAYGFGVVLNALTVLLDEMNFQRYDSLPQRLALLGLSLIDSMGYRQLTVAWRVEGLISFLRGRRDWGLMERRPPPSTHTATPTT